MKNYWVKLAQIKFLVITLYPTQLMPIIMKPTLYKPTKMTNLC